MSAPAPSSWTTRTCVRSRWRNIAATSASCLQDPFLFYGTIAENIAYGRPDASREDIVDGGAGGTGARVHPAPAVRLRLAGGRTRTVAVRRRTAAHLHRAGTAHRSAHSHSRRGDLVGGHRDRARDSEGAGEPDPGRTTIAIAHRLSTLRRADRLVVVENGHIAEIGRHDELLDVRRQLCSLASRRRWNWFTGETVMEA